MVEPTVSYRAGDIAEVEGRIAVYVPTRWEWLDGTWTAIPSTVGPVLGNVHDMAATTLVRCPRCEVDQLPTRTATCRTHECDGTPAPVTPRPVPPAPTPTQEHPTPTPTPAAPAVVSHPMQPVILDEQGVARFKQNAIISHLFETGALDLNALAVGNFPDEDRMQIAQLLGYSVSGFGDLSYATDQVVAAADAAAEAL